jgi:hypothetical protein
VVFADGFAPIVGAEGLDVLVLGDTQCLQKGVAEVGEGGGDLGLYLALGGGGEQASECEAKIAG